MATKRLTLIFESNTREAIRGVRGLYNEINKLTQFTRGNTGVNPFQGITQAIATVDAFTNRITQAQGRINTLSRNNVAGSIRGWVNEAQRFNTVIDKSIVKVKNLQSEAKKSLQALKKPIEIKINAQANVIQPKRTSLAQESAATEAKIRQTVERQIENENRQIRDRISREVGQRRERRQRRRTSRRAQAESFLQDLSGREQTVRPDEISSAGARRFYSQPEIEKMQKQAERIRQQKQQARPGFGTVQSRLQASGGRTTRDENLENLFQERLQQQVAQRKQAVEDEKARLRAEINRRKAEKEAAAKAERERISRIKSARRRGLLYEEKLTTDSFASSGRGFGGSNLRTAEQLRGQPTFGGTLGEFAIDTFAQSAPQGIQDIVQGTRAISGSLNISRVAAIGVGAAISGGIVLALNAANFAAGEFNRQMKVAQKDQLAMIGISSEVQRLYGVSPLEGDTFYERLQRQTEIAGRETSVSVQDIAGLNQVGITAYIRAFQGSGRNLDSLSKELVDLNTRFAILGQATPGVTQFQIRNAYTSALSGNLSQALKRQEFFRNAGFGDVVRATSADLGIDLTQATQQEQIRVFNEALIRRVPESLIERAQNDSVEAQLSAFEDRLFAQRTGIFGIQRDLDLDVEGNQSLFTEISRTVSLIFGSNGLFAQLGGIFGGLDFDILEALRNGLRILNDVLLGLNTFLAGINRLKDFIANIPILPGVNIGRITQAGIDLLNFSPYSAIRQGITSLFGGSSFTGNLPSDASVSPLMPITKAIAVENRNKPRNSRLLIANSSEYIFPNRTAVLNYARTQIPQLSTPVSKPSVSIAPGSIIINSNQSPKDIAEEVIRQLNNEFAIKSNQYL